MSASDLTLRVSRHSMCLMAFLLILNVTTGTAWSDAGAPGQLTIDGERVFPMGWFKLGATATTDPFTNEVLDEGPPHGFDFVMHYSPWPPHGNGIMAWMDAAHARSMKVMIDLRPLSTSFPTLTSMLNWTGHQGGTVKLKDHPALYGYYLEDEPDGRGLDTAALLADYNEVKLEDPCHLIFTSYYLPFSDITDYLAATDVAISELYSVNDWADVAADVATAAAEGVGYIGAPWATDLPAKPTFTAAEFKLVTFSAIVDGAGGIMPFIFEGHDPTLSDYDPDHREDNIYPTTDILAQITDQLAMGATGGISASSPAFETNFGAYAVGGDSERAVLVAVNHGAAIASVTFEVGGLSSEITEVSVLGEDRTIPLTGPSGNQLVDSFDATYGVHVYSFRTPCQILVDDGQRMPADFNADCHVDLQDFTIFAGKWFICADPNDPTCPGI